MTHPRPLAHTLFHIKEVIHPNMGFVRQLMRLETDLFKVSTSSLTWEEWPNTIYERVEQLGFKVPHDDKVMYLLEEKASRTYLDKYGQPNPHFTHDAGLDGKGIPSLAHHLK